MAFSDRRITEANRPHGSPDARVRRRMALPSSSLSKALKEGTSIVYSIVPVGGTDRSGLIVGKFGYRIADVQFIVKDNLKFGGTIFLTLPAPGKFCILASVLNR